MKKELEGKKIIVGVTASIAAYKSPLLVRELVKKGADVHVVLTPSSLNFVTPMTLANLSKNKVLSDMFDKDAQSGGAWHIELVHSCDLMIIAPCSAATLAKIANGICDNSLVTLATALPKDTPLIIAPAMDFSMFENPSTKRNIKTLSDDGVTIVPPEEGELSSGLIGPGRLPSTELLMEYILNRLNIKAEVKTEVKAEEKQSSGINQTSVKEKAESSSFTLQDAVDKDKWTAELELSKLKQTLNLEPTVSLSGKRVLITAGPTVEKLDAVRFISNYSSGKMGFALAEAAALMGAGVKLVSGPVNLKTPEKVSRFDVNSAEEMYQEVIKNADDYDIAILSAAVADFTPAVKSDSKLKKEQIGENWTLDLIKTKDILAELGKVRKKSQKLVGFALESDYEIENGWKKMKDKNCTMLIVNSANKPDSGFMNDKNTITILSENGKQETLEPMDKILCAFEILKRLAE